MAVNVETSLYGSTVMLDMETLDSLTELTGADYYILSLSVPER